MAERCRAQKSPRNGIPFREVPTMKASMNGGSIPTATPTQYGAILDCVFEMADQIATSNGVSHEAAIDQVLQDESWRILPKHKDEILRKLK